MVDLIWRLAQEHGPVGVPVEVAVELELVVGELESID